MGKIAVNVVLVVLLIVGLFISIPTTIAGSNLTVSYINVGQGLLGAAGNTPEFIQGMKGGLLPSGNMV